VGGACSANGGGNECVWVIRREPGRKETTGKTKTWVGNIRMDLVEIE
jgi:hypothetical protein